MPEKVRGGWGCAIDAIIIVYTCRCDRGWGFWRYVLPHWAKQERRYRYSFRFIGTVRHVAGELMDAGFRSPEA